MSSSCPPPQEQDVHSTGHSKVLQPFWCLDEDKELIARTNCTVTHCAHLLSSLIHVSSNRGDELLRRQIHVADSDGPLMRRNDADHIPLVLILGCVEVAFLYFWSGRLGELD